MRFKVIGVAAALALSVSACGTTSEESGAATGAGASASSGSTITPLPPAADLPLKDQFVVDVGDRVFFDVNKSDISADQRAVLDRQAAWLKGRPFVNVVVEGHADERGTREYNLALGERRANAAKDYLIFLGISADRIKTVSYGEERPVALGSDDIAWAQNRRAVTIVTGTSS